MLQPTVSILAEVTESLSELLNAHLDQRPELSQDELFERAIALYLIQNSPVNSPGYKEASECYMKSLGLNLP